MPNAACDVIRVVCDVIGVDGGERLLQRATRAIAALQRRRLLLLLGQVLSKYGGTVEIRERIQTEFTEEPPPSSVLLLAVAKYC